MRSEFDSHSGYYLLNELSCRRRKVIHVSFACDIPHVIIKCVA